MLLITNSQSTTNILLCILVLPSHVPGPDPPLSRYFPPAQLSQSLGPPAEQVSHDASHTKADNNTDCQTGIHGWLTLSHGSQISMSCKTLNLTIAHIICRQ